MIELLETGDGYLYGDTSVYKSLIDFTITNVENFSGMCIYSITKISFNHPPNVVNFSYSNYRLQCIHGNLIDYSTINQLPREGWEELIECWSCHNNEFKTMLDLDMRPRQKGILISDLYFLINDNDLPYCCSKNNQTVRRIFFNEIIIEGYSSQTFLYKFLSNYFKTNSLFFYKSDGKSYEMIFFYNCTFIMTKDGQLYSHKAIKVGMKETEKRIAEQNNINEYFKSHIQNIFIKTNIEMLSYEVGFIVEMI